VLLQLIRCLQGGRNCEKSLFINALVEDKLLLVDFCEIFDVDSKLIKSNKFGLCFAYCLQFNANTLVFSL